MMEVEPGNWLQRALVRVAHVVRHHPRAISTLSFALLGFAVVVTTLFLRFSLSSSDLIAAGEKFNRAFLQYKTEFGVQEDLVTVVESESADKNRQFVGRLAARLEAEPGLFKNVFFKGDLQQMGSKGLLFFSEQRLEELASALKKAEPLIQKLSHSTNLNSLFRLVNQQLEAVAQDAGARESLKDSKDLAPVLEALYRILRQGVDTMVLPGVPPSPAVAALFDEDAAKERSLYLAFAGGRLYAVICNAADESREAESILRLRELVEDTRMEVGGVNVGVTGEPVLSFDEMTQAGEDTTRASVVALLLVTLVFVNAYHEIKRPLKTLVCLLVGIGFTLGFSTIAIGHLNLLTITFVPILIGLAIDFGVHLLTRYEEELHLGRMPVIAISRAIVFAGAGIATSGFTTAGAFLAMVITDFKGIREMGIISGAGLLICMIPMMTLLPVMLLRERTKAWSFRSSRMERREKIERFWLNHPHTVLLVGMVLTVWCGLFFPRLEFDYNLLNLQSRSLPSVIFERKLLESSTRSVLYAAVTADTAEQAEELEQRISALPSVSSVESVARVLTERQDRKLKLVSQIKESFQGIEFSKPDPRPIDPKELNQTLYIFQLYVNGAANLFRKQGQAELADRIQALHGMVERFREVLGDDDAGQRAYRLAEFQQALFGDLRKSLEMLKQQDSVHPMTLEDLPAVVRQRFIGKTGKFLVLVFPREDLWRRENQERFVKEIRTIDPNVTGSPVRFYEYTARLKKSVLDSVMYALGAVVILIYFHFRRWFLVLLSLLPVALGFIWTIGLSIFLGISLNSVNLFSFPLIIGIGVTNGIHILNRYSEERRPSVLGKSTGKAVLVSALTTIIGFGTLMLGKHPGIASLGALMSLGTASCMVAGLTVLPAVLNLLDRFGFHLFSPRDEPVETDPPA